MSRHWREAGASDQRQRGNAADTHAISLVERELPSATYLKRFHPSVSVRGSNCLQKFASAIARLGWCRRAQRSSKIRNTIDRFLVAQQTMLVLRFTKTHTLNRIINYIFNAEKIFRVFNFRRNAISTKINYGKNFPIAPRIIMCICYLVRTYLLSCGCMVAQNDFSPKRYVSSTMIMMEVFRIPLV